MNGKLQTIAVHEVRPVLQPLGSFYSRLLGNNGLALVDEQTIRSGFGIVDVGMNTTDLSGLRNLVPEPRWSAGVRVGVRDALGIIADDIEDQYQIRRSVPEIAHALRTEGLVRIYRDEYTLDGNASPVLHTLGQQIVSEATTLWGQADRFHTILITGGGARLIGKAIKAAFPVNSEILPKPELANAVGFAKFANRKVFKSDKVK